MWQDLYKTGRLGNNDYDKMIVGKRLAIAVCVNIRIKPLSTETAQFSLVWNMPNIYFSGDSGKIFSRYYTRFFPFDSPNSSEDIACYSSAQKSDWLVSLQNWREPILENK